MSGPRCTTLPLTGSQNFLLAEILKQHSPPSNIFWNFVASLNPQPRWDDLPLPAGQSGLERYQIKRDVLGLYKAAWWGIKY